MSAKNILRAEITKLIAEARKIWVGNKLYLGNNVEIEAVKKKALAAGKMVTEKGVQSWIEIMPDQVVGRGGSARYIWDDSGNQVLAEKFLITKQGASNTRTSLGKSWVSAAGNI